MDGGVLLKYLWCICEHSSIFSPTSPEFLFMEHTSPVSVRKIPMLKSGVGVSGVGYLKKKKKQSTKNCERNIGQDFEMESKSIYFYSDKQKAKVPNKTNKQIGKITETLACSIYKTQTACPYGSNSLGTSQALFFGLRKPRRLSECLGVGVKVRL